MTPDSKKKTSTKTPAKEMATRKTAVSAKKAPEKKVTRKTTAGTKEAPAKKVARKTAAGTKEAPAKKVARKSATSSKSQASSIHISSEERWKMIAIAAYHKAENRGFAPGGELQDWAEAEQEVDKLLMSD